MKNIAAKIICLFAAGIIAGSGAAQHFAKSSEIAQEGYVIRMEGNFVNVYKEDSEGETFEKRVTEANTFDMPDETAKRLKNGIKAATIGEIEKIIEDITS